MTSLRMRLTCILLLLFGLLALPTVTAQEQPTLELVIALDTSGSMSSASMGDFNARRSVDYGNNLLLSLEGISTSATDPDAMRFRTTEMLLTWLATYAASADDDIQIRASVVQFDDTATVLRPMSLLSTSDANAGIQLEEPPPITTESEGDGRHSDFINLYETASDLYSDADAVSHAAFVLVTDSPPCNPNSEETRINDQTVRNRFCDNEQGVLAPHLQMAPALPTHVEEYVFFLNPTGRDDTPLTPDQYWSIYDSVRDAWVERVGSLFFDLVVVEDLPEPLLNALLRAIGRTLNQIDPEETPSIALNAAQYRRLGFLYTGSETLNVPPFQQTLQALVLSDTENTRLQYDAPSNPVDVTTRFEASSRRLQLQTIPQPPAGEWAIEPEPTAAIMWWGLLTPATVAVQLVPPRVEQYQPQQVLYQLLDADGDPLPVTEDLSPRFDLTVDRPGEPTLDLGTLSVNEDQDGFISLEFLPLDSGSYQASLDVEPGQDNIWTSAATYDFLQPDDLNLVAAPLTFTMDYLVEDTSQSNPVTMPRSLPLTLRLTASVSGEQVPLPDNLQADINLVSPPAGTPDACLPLDAATMQIAPDNMAATYRLDFDEPGACTVTVDLSLSSSLPPLDGDSIAIVVPSLDRQIDVRDTTLLNVVVQDEDGNDITANNPSAADFTLDWLLDEGTALIVEIQDEDGDAIWPDFSPDAQRADAEVCPSDERIVPFTLQIFDSNGVPNTICLQARGETGRYRAEIADLTPGTYTVTVVVDRNEPRLDVDEFEYNPAQFDAAQTEISGVLRVRIPLILWLAGLTTLAVVLWVGSSTTLLVNRRLKRLHGAVAFYGVSVEAYERVLAGEADGAESLTPLWREEWPARITHRFRSREFVRQKYLKELAIQSLVGTTAGSRERSREHTALITLSQQLKGRTVNPFNRDEFTSGEAKYVATVDDTRIYLMQDAPEQVTIDRLVAPPEADTDGQDA